MGENKDIDRRPNGVEPSTSEDYLQREQLGRGVPGKATPTKMTPQREKKTPTKGDFDGHTA